MKLWGSDMKILRDLKLIIAAIREQAKSETAYMGNFWFSFAAKIIYNIIFLVFIDVLFQRVGGIAGYSKNDFLFMYFISQIGFYTMYGTIFSGLYKLAELVNKGDFDLLLLKPVPHRAFLYVGGFRPYDFLFTLGTILPIVGSQIHWSNIHLSVSSIILGSIVWLGGQIIANTLIFALTLPAFKAGDSSDMLGVFYSINSLGQMPYSKLPLFMKLLSLSLLPMLVISAAASEVMLAKGNALVVVLSVVGASLLSLIIFQLLWRYALKNYTSASS